MMFSGLTAEALSENTDTDVGEEQYSVGNDKFFFFYWEQFGNK